MYILCGSLALMFLVGAFLTVFALGRFVGGEIANFCLLFLGLVITYCCMYFLFFEFAWFWSTHGVMIGVIAFGVGISVLTGYLEDYTKFSKTKAAYRGVRLVALFIIAAGFFSIKDGTEIFWMFLLFIVAFLSSIHSHLKKLRSEMKGVE